MKILNRISLIALLFSVGTATPLLADSLAPGQTVTPVSGGAGSFVTLGDTGAQAFSFGGDGTKDQGSVQQVAGTFSGNPFGPNDITFLYIFDVTKGDVSSISGSDFTGFLTDVADAGSVAGIFDPLFGAPTLAPLSVTRSSSGANIHFDFTPDADPGDTSFVLIINTNATTFNASTIGLLDSGGETLKGFEPAVAPTVPEPSSLVLLGTGILGMGAAVRRRFSI